MPSNALTHTSFPWLAQLSQKFLTKSNSLWIAALLCLAAVNPAQAQVEMRVAIEEGIRQVQIGSSTKATVRDAAGRVLGEIAPGSAYSARLSGRGVALSDRLLSTRLWVEPSNGGYVWIGDRWYRGRVMLTVGPKGLTAINYVDLEQYLYSVLGSEMKPNWPQEALKAQAVAARSYALYKRQSSTRSLFDVGDTTAFQVYKGVAAESPGTQMAVQATEGQVLIHKGKIIQAVFHSSAGGRTENSEFVWSQPVPYLRSVPDYDQGTPNYEWVKVVSNEELRARIPGLGNIVSFIPQRLAPSGRIITMKVVGDAGSRIISGNQLRTALNLKSTLFTVAPQASAGGIKNNGRSAPISFQITGRGFGHGLGMSQWGAYNMANQGLNYQQIVLHYYQGATLARIQVR